MSIAYGPAQLTCQFLLAAAGMRAAATAPASPQPVPVGPQVLGNERWQLAVMAAVAVVALAIAGFCGCLRPRSIEGPPRIAPEEPVSSLWLVVLITAGIWFMVPMAYGIVKVAQHPPAAAATATSATNPSSTTSTTTASSAANSERIQFTGQETVALGIAAPLAALLAALAGTMLRRNGFRWIGLAQKRPARTLGIAALGVVIVLPLVFFASTLTELFWQWIRFEHPNEHELLQILGESSSPAIRAGVILSAALVAPVFEELLFRGYLQTALLGMFSGHRPQRALAGAFSPPDPPHGKVAARWGAIVCTSFVFALVHGQLWMMPPIFVLSLCLGYTYERTANLWVPMLIHASFNATSLAIFLAIH